MKKLLGMTTAILLSLSAGAAFAQTPPPPPADGKGMGHGGGMRDCSKMEDADKRAMCEKRQAAMKAAWEKCKDKAEGPDRRSCMHENMPKPPEKK
ncbi:MAG: hypothetical protein ACKO1K_10350 [Burkholderiales bacterium]